jgi:oligo-1,6-glucosidase
MLRKRSKTLIYGDYKEYFPKDKNIYMYQRSLDDESYLIICSFSRLPVRVHLPKELKNKRKKLVLCNYRQQSRYFKAFFRPYEARVYLLVK